MQSYKVLDEEEMTLKVAVARDGDIGIQGVV